MSKTKFTTKAFHYHLGLVLQGLYYISEQDHPFKLEVRKRDVKLGRTEIPDFEQFFQHLIDTAGNNPQRQDQLRDLRQLLRDNLENIKILKLSFIKNEWDIYIYGINASGKVTLISTKSIET